MAGLEISLRPVLFWCLGILLPLCLPLVQFGLVYNLWSQHAVEVKRDYCQNSCWDTVFKAGYETGAGSYKHVYFNATWQSAIMWCLTLISAIMLYETIKYLVRLFINGRIRWRMAALFFAAVYPHYYAYWTLWGYLNDDYYEQFIVGIAGGHVMTSAWDQFVGNVMKGEGGLHQILRDLGFMIPDILHILLPMHELGDYARVRKIQPAYLISNEMALTTAAISGSIWLLSLFL